MRRRWYNHQAAQSPSRRRRDNPALGCSDCNEYNFKLSLQPPTRTTRLSQSQPVCSISWQCTKVASGYKPLTAREARQWDTERVEISNFAAPRFTVASNSNTASRARCLYTFEQAYNGLLVRLTNGSVLTGSSGTSWAGACSMISCSCHVCKCSHYRREQTPMRVEI